MEKKFKIAVCQTRVTKNKQENINRAVDAISTAAEQGAQVIALPEMFNCPYENDQFEAYSEAAEEGETIRALSQAAKSKGIYLIAGSIPEKDGGKLYNTSFIFDKNGDIIGRHRKMHLFDIDIQDGITFRESDTLSAGNAITVVDTEFCRIGVAICYDLRFPELIRLMALRGAEIIIVPAAFNMVTGPAHWESLMRIRAVDNQVYIAAISPSRDESAHYVAYGNSMIVEPWGNILSRAEEVETILYEEIDLERVKRIRMELPLLQHRRTDMYELLDKTKK